jgi:putative transposase
MVFKLTESASKNWRALNGSELLPDVISGVRFSDGVKEKKNHSQPKDAAA